MSNTTTTTQTINPDCHACSGTGTDAMFGTACTECIMADVRRKRMQQAYAGLDTSSGQQQQRNGNGGNTQAKPARSNKFAGKCNLCQANVAAHEGLLGGKPGAWTTTHKAGECLTTEQQLARKATQQAAQVAAQSGLNLSNVPSGKYAIPGGDTNVKIQIDNVTSGKWAGWVFVKDAAVYGAGKRYGSQRPNEDYRGQVSDLLAIIAADPKAAMAQYGKITSTCGICSKKLEDNKNVGPDGLTSVQRGIGPVCATKF